MNAWLFQDARQKKKVGEKECPWSVGWYDPDGKKKSKSIGSKSMAKKHARKVEGQLAAGTYQGQTRKPWDDFRKEYEEKITPQLSAGTRDVIVQCLNAFEKACNPVRVAAIKTSMVDDFISTRRNDRGRRPGSKLSPASINKELRHLKAAFRVANEWGYLAAVPKIRMVKESKKIPRFMASEHFAAMYNSCEHAVFPTSLSYSPKEWWQALVTFAYMTGWRISECLSLRREDLDLDAGRAITRADDNKGNRDESVPLHPLVLDHLKAIASFEPVVFPWYHSRRTLWEQFHKLQAKAGIHLPCSEKHEHTDACYVYSFHDLRRAFATNNAENLTADALQRLMRHQSYSTTQRYINMAKQVNSAVAALYVPEVLNRRQA